MKHELLAKLNDFMASVKNEDQSAIISGLRAVVTYLTAKVSICEEIIEEKTGNKNVSEVFYYANQNGIAAHYDYAPFGTVTRTARNTRVTNRDIISENPFRFSSEAHDDALGLVYYNYRHYDPKDGRWKSRDLNDERMVSLLYPFTNNNPTGNIDIFGLISDEDARLMYGELGGCILSLQKINGKNQYVPNAGIADAFVSLRSIAERNKKVYRKPPPRDPVNQKAWEVIKATEGGIDKLGGAMYYCINSLPLVEIILHAQLAVAREQPDGEGGNCH